MTKQQSLIKELKEYKKSVATNSHEGNGRNIVELLKGESITESTLNVLYRTLNEEFFRQIEENTDLGTDGIEDIKENPVGLYSI